MQLGDLLSLARDTVGDPRGVFRRLRALGLTLNELWLALMAVAAVSVVLAELSVRLVAVTSGRPEAMLVAGPFVTALIQLMLLAILTFGIHWGGRMFGGTGDFPDAMLAVIWMQFLLACLQAAQLVALAILPFVATLIGLVGLGLFFWLLTTFVAELHGFRSRPRVLAGILLGMLALSILVILFVALTGVRLPEIPDV